MWKSWELLKHGFLEGIKDNLGRPVGKLFSTSISRNLSFDFQCVKELTMVQLSVGMATGAAYLGSKVAGHYLPRWMVFQNANGGMVEMIYSLVV